MFDELKQFIHEVKAADQLDVARLDGASMAYNAVLRKIAAMETVTDGPTSPDQEPPQVEVEGEVPTAEATVNDTDAD